jgi:periplasmic divalent cation tolerance protein
MEKTLKSLHPYEEPEIIATPILTGSESYLNWIREETKRHTA